MGHKNNNTAKSFQDLRVWQEAYELAIMVYKLCESFPQHEQFGLASQMRRSAVSVCSNIAEGFGRKSYKDKDRFYNMAAGSLTELENQLLIAKGVGYADNRAIDDTFQQNEKVHKMLNALLRVNRQKGDKL